MCVYLPRLKRGVRRSFESKWLRRNGGSEEPAFGCSVYERLLKFKLSPLSNYPERRRQTRRWGASPSMRERRKDSTKMHYIPAFCNRGGRISPRSDVIFMCRPLFMCRPCPQHSVEPQPVCRPLVFVLRFPPH